MTPLDLECPICLETLSSNYMPLHSDKKDLSLKHIFHRSCIEPWLENNPNCPSCRSKISFLGDHDLIYASRQGDNGSIERLLNSGFFKRSTKIKALLEAISHKHLETASVIVTNQKYCQTFLKEALILSAKKGCFNLFKTIHATCPISVKDCEDCLFEAIKHNHLNFITQILEMTPLDISSCSRACLLAIDHFTSDLIPVFLHKSAITIAARSEACVKLGKKCDFPLIELLISTGPIDGIATARVIAFASVHKRFALATHLLQQESISCHIFKNAALLALKENKQSELIFYIKNFLSQSDTTAILEQLICDNEAALLDSLLDLTSMSRSVLINLRQKAELRNQEHIIEILNDHLKCNLCRYINRILMFNDFYL